MTKTKVIRVFSFIMALTLVFAMASTPAYAVSPRQFGAWIASALTALNITWNSTVAPYNQFLDYIADPFQISEYGAVEYVPYTNERTDDILNRSTLSISGDTVTIDGKEYTDIWLSHDAANKFRVNAFDIEDAWDIASQSEGIFVSGEGFLYNIPIFQEDDTLKSQVYTWGSPGVYNFSDQVTLNCTAYPPLAFVQLLTPAGTSNMGYNSRYSFSGNSFQVLQDTVHNDFDLKIANPAGDYSFDANAPLSAYLAEPFDFDYVSGIIPFEPIGSEDGLHLLVPTNPNDWSGDQDTQDIINDINNYFQLNPDIAPGVDVDLNTPGIIDKLDDLLDIISNIIKLTKPFFGPEDDPTPPEPPVPPGPTGELIPDTPWSYLDNHLKNIIQKLQDIIDTILSIPSSIISSISNLQNTLTNILQNIKDLLSNLVDNIVSGNSNWFKDIVDSIWNPFQRIFAVFKTHIGIWHYVVDWLRNISAPFTFFYNIIRDLGGIYTSPIYAAFAGVLVIAIYRRFGR